MHGDERAAGSPARPASTSFVVKRRSHRPSPRRHNNRGLGGMFWGVGTPAPNAWQQGGPGGLVVIRTARAQSERGGPASGLDQSLEDAKQPAYSIESRSNICHPPCLGSSSGLRAKTRRRLGAGGPGPVARRTPPGRGACGKDRSAKGAGAASLSFVWPRFCEGGGPEKAKMTGWRDCRLVGPGQGRIGRGYFGGGRKLRKLFRLRPATVAGAVARRGPRKAKRPRQAFSMGVTIAIHKPRTYRSVANFTQ